MWNEEEWKVAAEYFLVILLVGSLAYTITSVRAVALLGTGIGVTGLCTSVAGWTVARWRHRGEYGKTK